MVYIHDLGKLFTVWGGTHKSIDIHNTHIIYTCALHTYICIYCIGVCIADMCNTSM